MPETSFVGRRDAAGRLLAVLRGDDRSPGKLSVLSVEGPGGIGKTFLLDHVPATNDLSGRNYLTLRVDGGAAGKSVDLFSGVGRMVNAASALAIRGRAAGYYFSPTKRVLERIEGDWPVRPVARRHVGAAAPLAGRRGPAPAGDRRLGREALDVDKGEEARAPLHVGEVGPVDPRLLGEVFLRQSQFLAAYLHREAELLANIGGRSLVTHCGDVSRV